MILPAITPEMVRDRMTKVWAYANKLWHEGSNNLAAAFMREYDYLSNWQKDDCYV